MHKRYHSWGHYPRFDQKGVRLHWRTEPLPLEPESPTSYLPFGNGRSYGDVCLNRGGVLLDARGLNRFIAFDRINGLLRCESGVLLDEVLALTIAHGWLPRVMPGTRFVTIGGAIANDIHGKNHHSEGTFGRHVRRFELLRSDGHRLICSPTQNADWFRATIGGLGLTGLIVWAEIALKKINNPVMDVETIRYDNLNDFIELSDESDKAFEYTVAWVDTSAEGKYLGRGHFIRANHAGSDAKTIVPSKRKIGWPFELPVSLVNRTTSKIFNALYYRKLRDKRNSRQEHYQQFFFPLDHILDWNRVYGSRGFFQYQCLVPSTPYGQAALKEILERGNKGGMDCFLSVLKVFGGHQSPGMLSFPRHGMTITLDLGYRGEKTLQLLDAFDRVVQSVDGAVYPAKDARMSASFFCRCFPRFRELERFRDPAFSSSFWRRVTEGK